MDDAALRSADVETAPRTYLDRIEVSDGAALAVSKLTSLSCRWPIGDPQGVNFAFCCEPVTPGTPWRYCPVHMMIAAGPPLRPLRLPVGRRYA
ncbi:GcrA family cell cycle regulator [Rhodoblastus sp.]|uniref:GcrA family cell cycle regulator n=1 Tax=Rhodoblastus sp. TaxID=1962975 RepID=UPI003F9CED3C